MNGMNTVKSEFSVKCQNDAVDAVIHKMRPVDAVLTERKRKQNGCELIIITSRLHHRLQSELLFFFVL